MVRSTPDFSWCISLENIRHNSPEKGFKYVHMVLGFHGNALEEPCISSVLHKMYYDFVWLLAKGNSPQCILICKAFEMEIRKESILDIIQVCYFLRGHSSHRVRFNEYLLVILLIKQF